MRVKVTEQDIDRFFMGVMIECSDIVGEYRVPGWKCRACGWTIGTQGLPPSHDCPKIKEEPPND